ncbi:hypothetical protein [Sphingomonas sp.]|uniref:hypothetical protein n=1 Tax=Sphingomonas sp. TaxID=28214 RepID=UPI003D6D1DB0
MRRMLVRVSVAAILVAAPATMAAAESPAVVIATAPLVPPATALTYYGNPASPAVPTTRDPLIQETARSLRYNIDLIFEHVRDNVEYVPIFGLQKGGRGVVLDGAGTAFDQAQFLVDALRESDAVSGSTYQPSYTMGQITLSASDFASWTGVSDAAVATKLLANGGIPATVTGSGSSFTVTMEHVWVTAKVGGVSYAFDPSYKPHADRAGIGWQAASGYSQSALLASGGGANSAVVQGFNIAAFRQALDGYRANVEQNIATNARGMRASAAFGERNIVPHPQAENRRTSLPYVVATDRSWTGQIPDIYRSSFTVSLGGTAYGTYYADTVGEQMLRFNYLYNASTNGFAAAGAGNPYTPPVIAGASDHDCDQYLGSQPAAVPAVATIAINHPYAANSGSYADRVLSKPLVTKRCATGQFYVSNDWGYTGTGTLSRMRPAASRLRYDPSNLLPFTFGPTVANVASQYSALLNLASFARPSVYQMHDLIGVFTLDNANNAMTIPGQTSFERATFLSLDFEAAVSAIAKDNTTSGHIGAAYTAGLGLSYAEGSVPRQETDAVYDMAALTLFTQQDTRATVPASYSTYLTTSANWSSISGSLSQYLPDAKSAMQTYVNEGYSLLAPQYGQLRQPQISVPISGGPPNRTSALWEGVNTYGNGGELVRSTFLAWRPGTSGIPDRIALGIYDPRHSRVIKGGVGVAIDSPSGAIRKPDPPKAAKAEMIRATINIDGRSGALTYAPGTDLVDGPGDFPYSLSLKRAYDQRDGTNYGLGVGWKSNWNQVAAFSNDGVATLGGGGAQAVASALVGLYALSDLVTTQDAQHLYAATQVVGWLADTSINNVVTITSGLDGEQSFYRQQSGAYASGSADGSTLTQAGTPVTGIINRRLYSPVSLSYVDHSGTTRSYTQVGGVGFPSADLSSPGIVSPLSNKSLYLTTWAFPSGVNINATYFNTVATSDVVGLSTVANNLGSYIRMSFYDYGAYNPTPTCPVAFDPPVFTPARPASIVYQTSSGLTATYAMGPQVGFTLIGDPDQILCDKNKHVPLKTTNYLSGTKSFTDAAGATWAYGGANVFGPYDVYSTLAVFYKPSLPGIADVTISFGGDEHVRALTDANGKSWAYFASPFRSEALSPTQAAASPANGTTIYYDRWGQKVRSIDPLLRTTSTRYNDLGRVVETYAPEGNSEQTDYDARGNVVQKTQHAKPGTGLPDLVTITSYVGGPTLATCSNVATCNKPAFEIDALNHRASYSWDATHGQLLTASSGLNAAGGCLLAGGVCPVTTFGYGSFAGVTTPFGISALAGTLYLPISKQELIASGNATTTSFEYDSANKFALKGQVVDSAGLALRTCYTFDTAGRLIAQTDPKAGLTSCQ